MKVQIRSANGSCREVDTVRQAIDLAEKSEGDYSIHKISFSFGSERIILDSSLDGEWVLRTDLAFLAPTK